MWKKLKNLFKRRPHVKEPKAVSLDQVLKKIPKKANETPEERRRRIKINKRINEIKV
jgi:hypothetical protein